MSVTILVLTCPIVSPATETDSYTYSCIKLEDSSRKINFKLNEILRDMVSRINGDISRAKKPNDINIKNSFSYYYYKEMFVDDYGADAFSVFETCIDTNKCEGWPYFERVSVNPEESIYFETDFSHLSKKYLASNIEACGVRFSTDKLTHMLKDGFRYFYAKNYFGLNNADILRISKYSESTIMGLKSTGVYSPADTIANIKGVEFFENLLAKHLLKQKNGLVQFRDVEICDFINPNFDERNLKNSYVNKSQILQSAIEKRILQCSDSDREKILSRTHDPKSIENSEKAMVTFRNISEIFNSDARMLKKIMGNFFPSTKDYNYPVY